MKFLATLLPLFISLTVAIPFAAPAPAANAMIEKRAPIPRPQDTQTQGKPKFLRSDPHHALLSMLYSSIYV